MARILRKIDNWLHWIPDEDPEWLEDGEFQADVFKSLDTTGNCLSVWRVDEEFVTVKRVAAALGATRNSAQKFDFVLFDEGIVESLGWQVDESEGKTGDCGINGAHLNLSRLSGRDLALLVVRLRESGTFDGFNPEEMSKCIAESIDRDWIVPDALQPGLAKHVRRYSRKVW